MPGVHNDSSSRAPWWKGTRGEWYVVGQIIIFGLILVGPRSVRGLPPGRRRTPPWRQSSARR